MRECVICHACGCGTVLYERDGQLYCTGHLPPVPNQVHTDIQDDQVLTMQQKINLGYGG